MDVAKIKININIYSHDVERVQARGADEVDGARDELVARGASLR